MPAPKSPSRCPRTKLGRIDHVHVDLATCRRLPDLTADDGLLARALEVRGATVRAAPWDTIEPAASGDRAVCLRSTWDYHRRWTEFRAWIEAFAAAAGRLWNPAPTVLWNADKIYLRELADAGVRMPATIWTEPGTRPSLDRFLDERGVRRAVLKPRISATAHGTFLIERGRRLTESEWAPLEATGALLQTFVPEIADGEAWLVFIDGTFTHAVLKRPVREEFRVQRDFGGSIEPLEPSRSLRAFAERVLSTVSQAWVYARMDIVQGAGAPVLMELELIEPDLFFSHCPTAAERLAAALLRRASGGRVAGSASAGVP